MAKVYMETTDTTFTVSNNGVSVFGADGTQAVVVSSGVTGTIFDQNVERVTFSGASSDYRYIQSAAIVKVYSSANVLLATIPVQGDTDGTQLTFSNGTANAVLTSGVIKLGNTALDTSVATAVTPAVIDTTVTTSGTAANTTTALTTNADTAVGTYIDGSRFLSGGAYVDTLTSSDRLTGTAATNDTLFVQFIGNESVTPAAISLIENLTIENTNSTAGPAVLDLQNGDSLLKTITMQNTSGTAPNGITVQNNPAALTTLNMTNVANNVKVSSVSTAVSGTADALTVNMSAVSWTGAAGTIALDIAGYETVTINSNGSVSNSLSAGYIADSSLTTLNLGGTQAFTFTLNDNAGTNPISKLTKIDGTNASGKLSITLDASAVQNVSIIGGSGADTIKMNGTYTSLDTIAGGSGSDTLTLTNAEATGATATQSNVSSIENITLTDAMSGLIDLTKFGATGLTWGATDAATAQTINYAAGAGTLTFGANAQSAALTVNSTGVATTDALTITIGSSTASAGIGMVSILTSNGFETVNVVSQGGANTLSSLTLTNTPSLESIVITGSQSLTLATAVTADVINASGMTGNAALIMGGNGNAANQTITGSLNADTLYGGTAADIITGGAGNDTLYNNTASSTATAADVITGGDGYDTFVLRGDLASGTLSTQIVNAAYITDFVVGSSATTTDILALSSNQAHYGASATGGANTMATGTVATSAGGTTIMSVAVNAAATAYVTGTDLIKLSSGVATTGLTVQQAFNAAIGTAAITSANSSSACFFSLYDTTNSRMIIGLVEGNTAGGTGSTAFESGDIVTLVGSIAMTATDYSSFGSANLSIV